MSEEITTVEQTTENEETAKAEETKPEYKYTDEDVDKIVSKKIAKERERAKAEADEAARLAKMTEQERTAAELKKALDEVEALRAEKARNEMRATARKMLSDASISVSDGILNVLVTDDADSTKKAVEDFAATFKSELDKAVKAKLGGEPPKVGGSSKTLTKEDILAVENREERQRLIAEHLDLFE